MESTTQALYWEQDEEILSKNGEISQQWNVFDFERSLEAKKLNAEFEAFTMDLLNIADSLRKIIQEQKWLANYVSRRQWQSFAKLRYKYHQGILRLIKGDVLLWIKTIRNWILVLKSHDCIQVKVEWMDIWDYLAFEIKEIIDIFRQNTWYDISKPNPKQKTNN